MTSDNSEYEDLKKKTIDFLMGMMQEKYYLDRPSEDYLEGTKYFTDKKAKNRKVLLIGEKYFTPKKILAEIKNDGEFAKVLVKMISDNRNEIIKEKLLRTKEE